MVCCVLSPSLFFTPAKAQVTPDGTTNSTVNAEGNNFTIENGDRAGSNLFHSFSDFSVPNNGSAFFDNATDITNIFSRVTGGNISNIDGLIRANDANLFLINPAGILFGAGARLDLGGGSFYGSSADSILFEDGEFSAVDFDNPPLLTINAPIGLSFRNNPTEINVRGDGNGVRLVDSEVIDTQDALRVGSDATIGIVGGNLNFEDATIKTAGGRIELGSVAGGRVDLLPVANGFTFDYSGVETFQDISLSGTSIVDASGLGGGDIQVAARNISINDSSAFNADTLGSNPGGDINILATDTLEISGVENDNDVVSGITNQIFPNGTADGGDINIQTGNLRLGDRALIGTFVQGEGNAGNVNINASDSVSLASQGNRTEIASNVTADALGNAGDINLTTSSLTISNGALLNTSSFGQGEAGNINITTDSFNANNGILLATSSGQENAGNLTINAISDVNLTNNSIITVAGTEGSSGNIELNVNSLTISDSPIALFASSLGQGAGGNILLNASEDISITNNSGTLVQGSPGGFININARNLSLLSGSTFLAGAGNNSNFSDVRSGDIVINLTEDLILDGLNSNEIATSIGNNNFGQGNSGDIEVHARNITFNNGGFISNSSLSTGNTGSVTLNASGDIAFDGIADFIGARSGISNLVGPEATGNVGAINLTAQNLTLTNGGEIASSVSGRANSGNINLNIVDTIIVDGFDNFIGSDGMERTFASDISSNVNFGAVGNAGNINIDTQNLFLSRNGNIGTSLFQAQGNAGNININANQITIGVPGETSISPSAISSEATTGILDDNPLLEANAGNITITTGSLSISDGGSIEVGISAIGNGGDITINARDTVSINGTGTLISPLTQNEVEVSSDIRANTLPNSVGNGGSIEIKAANFSLTNKALVNTSSTGQGDAGNINIEVADTFTATDNSLIVSNVGNPQEVSAVGKVGSISINANEVVLSDTAQIQAGLFSGATGDPGVIAVSATESISLTGENTGIFSNNDPTSVGDASNTQLSAPEIFFDNGAVIQASNEGEGNGGNILITADNLNLDRDNIINAVTASGTGGTITLQIAENIFLRRGNLISAEAINDANGGNINIDTRFIVAFPNGNNDIVANAEQGNGGNINITAESLFGIEERPLNPETNDINASSEFGLDGSISIVTPDVNRVQTENQLPANPIKNEETTAQACQSDRLAEQPSGSLTIKGKGGIPSQPTEPFTSGLILVDGRITTANPRADNPDIKPIKTSSGDIIPARGIIKTEDGQVILTAYHTDNPTHRTPHIRANCTHS